MKINKIVLKFPIINNKSYASYNYSNFSKSILYNKYSLFKYSYLSICIKNLIFNEKCRIVARFKDYLIYDDDTEFLKTYYEKKTLIKNLTAIIDYYDKYNKVFPNYMILPENIFMYKNLRKKQKMIDEINKMKKKKENNENNNDIDLKNKNNVKEYIKIFDEKIKENINRQNNSMLTISLTNTFISNYINNNENKKNESNIENNYSNSFINISFYNLLFNNNNNNHNLYNDSMKSESSLKNIVDTLNIKKFKKIDIANNKIRKNQKLNIDILSSNHINNNFKKHYNNNNLTSNIKNQNYIIKTPTKNKLLKKEKYFKHIYQVDHKSLNNNRAIFNHKKNISDVQQLGLTLKSLTGEILSKKKTYKFINKFPKQDNKDIIEEITTSIIGKYMNKQRNKYKKKTTNEIKKIIYDYSKNKENFANNTDNYAQIYTRVKNNSKEKNVIKVNNYLNFKKINKYSKHKFSDLNKNNLIIKDKKRKLEEELKTNGDSKTKTIYELFQEKYKSNFDSIINEKRKEVKRHTTETYSSESTKVSLNRKEKFNFHINCDKINNNNNQLCIYFKHYNTNNEALQTQSKEELLFNTNYNNLNNCDINNQVNFINNTENNNIVYENNLGKYNQKQNKVIIENKKMIHKKHKTFSQLIKKNDLCILKKDIINNDSKTNYLNYKLKIIKEEIIKNKNNYKEIKEKYRKLSEGNQKKIITYDPSLHQPRKSEKMVTNTLFDSNNIGKKEKNYNNNKIISNELISQSKIKSFKKDKIILLKHQRHFSNINNLKITFVKFKKEATNKRFQINKEKMLSSKVINKKIIK